AIGNTRRLELKRGWSEPAILWTVVVGTSGSHKSPAFSLATEPVRERQKDTKRSYDAAMERHKSALSEYERTYTEWRKKRGSPPPDKPKEPTWQRFFTDDATTEALMVLLTENWRGLLVARDELSGWLGSFDRYSKAKGGDAPKWLEMHGGRAVSCDRKSGPRNLYVE